MNNFKGFTASELLVTTAIVGIIGLLMAGIIQLANYYFLSYRDKFEAETTAARFEYTMKLTLSQAIEVPFSVAGVTGNGIPANMPTPGASPTRYLNGMIMDGIDGVAFTRYNNQNWHTLAAFNREISSGRSGNPRVDYSIIQKTAIFYLHPRRNFSGVVFIDLGQPRNNPNNTASNAAPLRPGYDDLYFDRISSLRIIKSRNTLDDKVTSVEVEANFRYHINPGGVKNWCPAESIGVAAQCSGVANDNNWRDLGKRFTVLLRSNLIGFRGQTQTSQEERVLGNLYFFQPVIPTTSPVP